jgi:hypothetical protein
MPNHSNNRKEFGCAHGAPHAKNHSNNRKQFGGAHGAPDAKLL